MSRKKGDNRGRTGKEHWAKMHRSTLETEAWKSLSLSARAIYPWILFEWHGPNANNNGKIQLSVRQVAQCCGISINTAAKAFHDLQAKGFLVLTQHATLGSYGEAKTACYEITEIVTPLDLANGKRQGKKLFESWRNGRDYPVLKSPANNPTGYSGKNKTPSQILGKDVTNFETFRDGAS